MPLILLGIATEILLRGIPNEYSIKREFLDKNASEINVIILGSSHAYRGINTEYFSDKAFNAAMFSQSLDLDYKILDKYKGEMDNLNTIIIPISYPTLYTNLEMGIENWRIKNYNIYYDFSNDWNFANSTEILNSTLKKNLSRIKDYYIFNKNPIEMAPLGWEGVTHRATKLELEKTGIEAATRHTIDTRVAFNDNVNYLKKITSLAAEHNWQIILVIPPAYKTYRDNLSVNQLAQTIYLCENISLENSHVDFMNLLDSNIFNEADFYDADHLNVYGAKKLSILLDNTVNY
jgi:hypothetical protein